MRKLYSPHRYGERLLHKTRMPLREDPTTEKFQGCLDRKVKPRLTELLTGYGDLGLTGFDVPRVLSREQAMALGDHVNELIEGVGDAMNSLLRSALMVGLLAFAPHLGFGAPKATLPNIVFILADDQGYGDLGCFGSKTIRTPNIDSMAEDGMKFESFYVHNRCSPTRAAFMTGCHAQRVDMGKVIYHKDRSGLNADEITVAERLKEAGYATGIIGKWHLGEWPQFNPTRHGFDYFLGYMDHGGEGRVIMENMEKIADVAKDDRFSHEVFLPAGVTFIRDHKDEPFFLYYASNIPHTKWIPHADFKGSSEQGAYGDCVQQLDWEVGELLKELKTQGLKNNTLVVFASDNGPQLNIDGYGSAGPLRDGKWTDFEGGIRVPCVMRWPGRIPPGSTNRDIVGIIDMLPTFCEIIGVDVPSDRIIDGKSILPYMLNQPVDKPIHEHFIVPGATIRYGDWKLFVKPQKPGGSVKPGRGKQGRVGAAEGSLFNLREDIGETTEVSTQYPEKTAELKARMDGFMNALHQDIRPREYVK